MRGSEFRVSVVFKTLPLERDGERAAVGSLTFNCRVILVHKVTLDELNSQARLSDATAADNHQLVLS